MKTILTVPTPHHPQVSRIAYFSQAPGRGYVLFDQRGASVLIQSNRSREDFRQLCEDAASGERVLSTWWYPPKKGEPLPRWPKSVTDLRMLLAWYVREDSIPNPQLHAPLTVRQ